ncbi:MAG: NAD(P)-dependent oxidoreductase [Candidatus Poribacteria bacterium]|nr:NAD(P)-dependent oxidoreductase [Candidatus Poribacteria bacterium]MDP6750945.1 NAD(P)-dependent oxidoreductase [Candidatus Poribacteria bacterium]MDP6995565.1 NAD(P)-dependent oxidoreductase [Candidatus Poribacteria bacterium]
MLNADFTIGFVGVGRMGSNIARHLNDEGFSVTAVYDSTEDRAQSLAEEIGTTASSTLAGVTALADYVITVVTDDEAMCQIFSETADDSLLQDAEGTVFINCATLTPGVHVEIEQLANRSGADSLEGCMASSITQAREGTLYLMCGGKEEVFEQAKPILESMSVSLRYIGEAGRAAQVKALVNMVMNINTAGLAEGLGLGDALGLDLEILQEVFSQTGANSRVLETDGEDMQLRDHECYFSSAHAAKDSGIALDLADDVGLSLPLAKATKAQFDRMIEAGKGELDKSGVAELTFKGRNSR